MFTQQEFRDRNKFKRFREHRLAPKRMYMAEVENRKTWIISYVLRENPAKFYMADVYVPMAFGIETHFERFARFLCYKFGASELNLVEELYGEKNYLN